MSANIAPIFVGVPNTGIVSELTAANTATDGTGTVATLFTAGANGGFIRRIRAKAVGTNVLTVLRIFVNNGSATTSAANNALFAELVLAAATATNNGAIGPDAEIVLNLVLAPGYVITCCLGTAVAAGVSLTAEGGNY